MLKPDGNTTFSAESERLSAFLCNFAAENEYTYIISNEKEDLHRRMRRYVR